MRNRPPCPHLPDPCRPVNVSFMFVLAGTTRPLHIICPPTPAQAAKDTPIIAAGHITGMGRWGSAEPFLWCKTGERMPRILNGHACKGGVLCTRWNALHTPVVFPGVNFLLRFPAGMPSRS